MQQSLIIENISCAGCVRKIENHFSTLPEVTRAEVNFPLKCLMLDATLTQEEAIQQLDSIGFQAHPAQDDSLEYQNRQKETQRRYQQRLRNSALSLLLGVPLIILGFFWDNMQLTELSTRLFWAAAGLLTAGLMYLCGRHFFTGAVTALKAGSTNMDTLIVLGTTSAWLFSMLVVCSPDSFPAAARHVYFEASIMIIALVNLGQALELRAQSGTTSAIERLLNLRPKTACLVKEDGQEVLIPLASVKAGDRLRLKPGETVPVDAVIETGQSHIDEAMLTGEPLPKLKRPGDKLAAGTCNQESSLLIRAHKVGSDTQISQIIEHVKAAQNSRPAIATLVNQVTGWFVPGVIGISLLTALIWWLLGPEPKATYMLITAISVLIIACPCALGLATPTSVIAGMGRSAELGILIKDADALQTASRIDTLFVDKTGTLTQGTPVLTGVYPCEDVCEMHVLQLADALERHSEHPLAKAITSAAKPAAQDTIIAEAFRAYPGLGAVARVDQTQVAIGNLSFMQQEGVDMSTLPSSLPTTYADTRVYVAQEQILLGVLTISDPIKPDTQAAVERLTALGVDVIMLTGDTPEAAAVIADQAGIADYQAQLLPTDKAQVLVTARLAGKTTAMAGDGINDAPALAQAHVSFAMGKGTDIALDSANIVLMRDSLQGVADSIELSRAAVSNIKQNLLGAFIYNSLSIPVAAGLLFPLTGWLLSPVIAGGAMALSSVTVVSNASRLRRFKPKERP